MRHLEQPESAQQKCQARLQEELGKALEMQKQEGILAAEAAKKKRSHSVAGGCKSRGKDGTTRKVTLTPAQPLDKGSAASSSSCKPQGLEKRNKKKKDLKKSKEEPKTSSGLEKPGLEKPLAIVDWHQILENNDAISERDLHALELLASRCRVCILSYVACERRAEKVLEDIQTLVPFHEQLFGKEVCWAQVGHRGKCHIACDMDAMAIFDDNRKNCQECMEWGLDVYPIRTQHQPHKWILAENSFGTFAEAVGKFFSQNPKL